MKQNRVKLTVVMVLIMVMSLTLFTAAYAAVYQPELLNSTVKNLTDIAEKDDEDHMIQLPPKGSETSALPIFDELTLAAYNGKNGQPSYVAFEGVVYEVSSFTSWVGGFHHGYEAGKDLTAAFQNSPHAKSIFETAKVIGTYGDVGVQTPVLDSTLLDPTLLDPTLPDDTQSGMTLTQLAAFNGQNGQPAYIAVNGIVYDVTSYWYNGQHKGLTAGGDMTAAFTGSPHSQSLLNELPVIGSLAVDQQVIDPILLNQMGDEDDEDDEWEYEDDEDDEWEYEDDEDDEWEYEDDED